MSWRIRIRDREQCEEQPFLSPDLVLKQSADGLVYFDFALAEASETRNRGGLRSKEGLMTAIVIQLFTDARALDDDILPDDLDPDRRGWWGDGAARAPEQGDHGIGSRLWILRRSPLDDDTAARANEIVADALQPIVDQGAVARFEVETESNYRTLAYRAPETGILAIGIKAFDTDGVIIYAQRFEVLWDQVREARGTRRAFAI